MIKHVLDNLLSRAIILWKGARYARIIKFIYDECELD